MWMFLACFLAIGCHRLENTFLVETRLKRQTIKGSIGESQGNGIESLKVVCKPVLLHFHYYKLFCIKYSIFYAPADQTLKGFFTNLAYNHFSLKRKFQSHLKLF